MLDNMKGTGDLANGLDAAVCRPVAAQVADSANCRARRHLWYDG
jgi:hypothetical protein